MREVGPQDVSFAGHGGQLGMRGNEILGVLQRGDDHHAPHEPAHGAHQLGGPLNKIGHGRRGVRPGRTRDRAGRPGEPGNTVGRGALTRYVPRTRHATQQQRRPPRVLLAQQADRVRCRGRIRHGHRIRRSAQCRRHRHLVARGHRQKFRGRAEQTRQAVLRGEQHPRAVLAAQAQGQCLVAGRYRRPLALRTGGGLPGGREGRLRLRQLPSGGIVPLAQLRVARVQALHLGLELLVLLLRCGCPLLRLVARGGQPVDLRLRRTGPASGRIDLSGQPRQPFAPVRDGSGRVLQPALFGGQLPFQFGPVGGGVLQRVFRRLQRGLQLRLLLTDPGGLALHVLRVATAPLLLRCGGGALHPGVGERDRAAYPFGQLRELVPGLLGALQPRRQPPYLVLQLRLTCQSRLELCLSRFPALLQRSFVGDLAAQRVAQPHQVVGEQPQAGVAQIGLDDGGPPGHGRLSAQRFQLPPQFVRQILDAGQVGPHRVQFPQRLLLPLAVLQHACGFLDERAPPHRIGMEYGVQLALPHDDVHLPADTGVREQFLDVEEPAGVAVDLVFAAAVAEHDPSDRHFGVFDGQRTIRIVDGQRHFGASERRPPGGAGEDHVFHLAAAQGFGSLLTHDPGERIHHIGLAGTVGTDDTGDPRFEPQGRGGGERFETTQGQGLEMHAAGLYLSLSVSLMKVQGTSDGKGRGVRPGAVRRRSAR